jgi:peptide/nickel transport system substrate-binding protein
MESDHVRLPARQVLGWSRRQVLTGALACGASGSFARPGRAQGVPQRGGILTMNSLGDPPTFDLLSNGSGLVVGAVAPCYNGLVQFAPLDPTTIVGDLARSWEISGDGRTYTFHLIPGVRFHDGKALSSADVKFTFDILRRPPAGFISIRQALFSVVESISTPDEATVRFHLSRPSASFLVNLVPNWCVVLPKHILEKGPMKDVVVGTGPYMFKSISRGNNIELVRNPNYHVKDRPYLDGITLYVVPDPGTAMAYFRSGRLNFLQSLTSDIARQISAEMPGRASVQTSPSLTALAIYFNTRTRPWGDPRVRKAVALAIDREAALAVNFRGDAALGGMTPPTGVWRLDESELHAIPGFAPGFRPAALQETKALLAAAGFPNGLSARLVARRDERFSTWAVFLKDQLAKIGVDVRLDLKEPAAVLQAMRDRDFELFGGNVDTALDDPDAVFANTVLCDAPGNLSQICEPSIDELFARQSATLDPKERLNLVRALERRILTEHLIYPVAFSFRQQAMRSDVHNYLLHPQSDNNRRYQDVWISRT